MLDYMKANTNMSTSFYLYTDKAGEYRWTLEAANGKTIADSGEGYRNKSDCQHAVGLVMDTSRQTPFKER
jgi:uncharacterized protein YegP (UPF0339 family)